MTKKYYELLAAALKTTRPTGSFYPEVKQWTKDLNSIIHVLARDNPRFNEDKFREACGYE